MTCVKIKLIRDNKKYKRHYPTISILKHKIWIKARPESVSDMMILE